MIWGTKKQKQMIGHLSLTNYMIIDIDIDIDIFQNCLIDIDIDIDIFQKCRYIDNRYFLSIF